jgi:ComF family protein
MPVSCRRCAASLPDSAANDSLCGACQLAPPPFIRAAAAFEYEFPVDTALKFMKFNRKLHYIPAFSATLLHLVETEFRHVDALLPVPLHRWRYLVRGFNQAVELSRPLARATGLPMLRHVRRIRATATQSGLKAGQRRRNLAGAFRVCGGLRCHNPLIVDDVMTTGETCRQLAITLLDAGVESVSVLVVARA